MTDKEKAIRWFENIAYACDKLTSGNVAHLKVQIKGMAIRSAEYLKKNEPASEDLEQAAEQAEQREGNLINGRFKAGFKSGAYWQKEQMMKDAMECHVDYYDGPILDFTQKQLDGALERIGAKVGDKVKVIIIKE